MQIQETFEASTLLTFRTRRPSWRERMEGIKAVPTVGRIWSHGAPLE
jgi:hypothetical protein